MAYTGATKRSSYGFFKCPFDGGTITAVNPIVKEMSMIRRSVVSVIVLGVLYWVAPVSAQGPNQIPSSSKVFIAPMDGFETFLKAAFEKKEVPLVVVEDKDKADFEITGKSDSQKASIAKKIIMWNWHSREEASINVTNLKTGEVAFAYSVHKESSAHGKRSTAEACAKHLKEKISSK
jgi:hypothetical protein